MLYNFQDWVIQGNVAFVLFTSTLPLGAWNCQVRSSTTMTSPCCQEAKPHEGRKKVLHSTAPVAFSANHQYQLPNLWVHPLDHPAQSNLQMTAAPVNLIPSAWETPSQNHPAKLLQNSWCKKYWVKQNGCFKPLSLGVICYATIVAKTELFQSYFYFLLFRLLQNPRKSEVSDHLQERSIFSEALDLELSSTLEFLEFANS